MTRFKKYSAKWCAPCKALDPILDEIEKDTSVDVEIERLDIEEVGTVKCNELGIRSVPTLHIVDESDTILRTHVGMMNKDELIKFING